MIVSATDLSSYLFCPRKLYMRKVLGIVEPPNQAMVLGTIRHAIHEKLSKADESIIRQLNKDHSESEAATLFKNDYLKALRGTITHHKSHLKEVDLVPGEVFVDVWPFIYDEALSRASEIYSFAKSAGVYGEELWSMLPKTISEYHVQSEALQLKGIIDKIEVRDGKYIPFELKTGSAPREGVWPGHKIQVACYAMLLQEAFKTPVNEGFVVYLNLREKRRVAMNPFLEEEVKLLISKVQALLESKELPEPCGKKICGCNNFVVTTK
ncbi:CRISPR-associated protein Cas4 [Candidatus Woesearchaeota archaeon]|nr:CRISPR-associated protein Cas4 [Candidatus Woesearchaeota archaeon]